uniref:Uncharacterized protein n=1 Tax=Trichuris muris TaxID=70415 RepID=A0A5S6QEY7_TRIMR
MFNFCLYRAVAVPRLDVGARVLHLPAVKAEWQHLKDLPFPSVTSSRVEVLIGMDVPLAHRHYDMRCDSWQRNAPVGLLTPFGWTIVGQIPNASFCTALPNQTTWIRRHACTRHAEPLKILLEQFLNADALTVQATNAKVTVEERIALKTMEDSLRFNGTRYEIGLLWKSADIFLPNNREAALKRFFATERRLLLIPSMKAFYSRTIQQYIEEGHARKLTLSELNGPPGRTWYLPHHAVEQTRKPGHYRIVSDASARCAGLSLNDCLLKGPDYLANLGSVLLRFRQNPVPVSADIQRMYHQVLVSPKDRSALRFLWREPGTRGPPETYEMLVHVVGATSSPSVCMFAI